MQEKNTSVTIEELQKKLEEQAGIFDAIPAWIFYKNKENTFIKVNRAFCEAVKKTKAELEGKSLFDLYPKEIADAYWKDDKEVIASGVAKLNIVEPLASKEVGTIWVSTNKIPYKNNTGEIIGVIGFSIDITKIKLVEDKLKESEERFRSAFEASSIGMGLISLGGSFMKVNNAMGTILEVTSLSLEGKAVKDMTYPSDRDVFIKTLESLEKNSTSSLQVEIRFIKKNGTLINGLVSVSLVKSRDGHPLYFVIQVADVTLLKKASELEMQYRALFEYSNDAIFTFEPPDWHFKSVNPAAIRMFNVRDEDEFKTLTLFDISAERQRDGENTAEEAPRIMKTMMERGEYSDEWLFKRYQGLEFIGRYTGKKLSIGGREFIQAAVRDISEQKENEKKIQSKINELNTMNSLMVGREVKMVELKNHIKELEKKIEALEKKKE